MNLEIDPARVGGIAARQALLLVVPTLWLGFVLALAFVETPLKFTAPGMTLPLALGLGRLVFNVLELIGVAFAVVMTVLLLVSRGRRSQWGMLGGMWAILLVELLVLRPMLAARTDLIIAGDEVGESSLHIFYIAADTALVLLLVMFIAFTIRGARAR